MPQSAGATVGRKVALTSGLEAEPVPSPNGGPDLARCSVERLESPMDLGESCEARSGRRSNVFLAAVLQGPDFSAPVRLRNISAAGALAEAAAVPRQGSKVRLVRGALAVPATVAWSADGRCGLQFASLVSVAEWMAPPANREQERVDEAVRLLKTGAIPLEPLAQPERPIDDSGIGADVRNVASLLETVSGQLVTNDLTVSAHGDQLQSLDIAIQTLNAIADGLDRDAGGPSLSSRLDNLRASCREALKQGR